MSLSEGRDIKIVMVAGVRLADPARSEEARSILEIDSKKFRESN